MGISILNKVKKQGGFSVPEVLVAIFILLTGILALSTLVTSAVRTSSANSSKLIAANLAQEGLEIVRAVRDLNLASDGTGWDSFFNKFCADSSYAVQYDDDSLDRAYEDTFLKFDSSTGFYGYDSGTDTIFKRKIELIADGCPNYFTVVSQVTWTQRGQNYIVTAQDQLWNWR
jgi:type II secretory pathway pseudopilin PulG